MDHHLDVGPDYANNTHHAFAEANHNDLSAIVEAGSVVEDVGDRHVSLLGLLALLMQIDIYPLRARCNRNMRNKIANLGTKRSE